MLSKRKFRIFVFLEGLWHVIGLVNAKAWYDDYEKNIDRLEEPANFFLATGPPNEDLLKTNRIEMFRCIMNWLKDIVCAFIPQARSEHTRFVSYLFGPK
jgi:hypothetical protein